MTDYEIMEWFYGHDVQWQNDIINWADCGDNEVKLIDWIKEHHFDPLKEDKYEEREEKDNL